MIILDEQPHDTFVRKGHNLVMQVDLELVEALCGCTRPIATLDSRYLVFSTFPGFLFYVLVSSILSGPMIFRIGTTALRIPDMDGRLSLLASAENTQFWSCFSSLRNLSWW